MPRMMNNHAGEVALAALAARQDAFESDLKNLSSAVVGLGNRIDDAVASINSKIDQRSQPQWQTYIMAATLIGGLFFAFISPLQRDADKTASEVSRIDSQHHAFEKETDNKFVSIREHEEFKKEVNDKIDHNAAQVIRLWDMIWRLSEKK